MQITIEIPDGVSLPLLQPHIDEFQNKLRQLFSKNQYTNPKQRALMNIIHKSTCLPILDTRTEDEILGYDTSAVGLWSNRASMALCC